MQTPHVRPRAPLWLRMLFAIASEISPNWTARQACKMFMTPFASTRKRALRASLAGARQGSLRSQGVDVVTYLWGDPTQQPALLFAHGWSSFGLRVVPWLPLLTGLGFAVISFDQVAHGKSAGTQVSLPGFAQTIRDVVAHFGPVKAIIGHSLGAGATVLALADGLVAKRAVLIAPAADGVSALERFARAYGLRDGITTRMRLVLERLTGRTMRSTQAYQTARYVGIPVLVVHDVEDQEVPWSEGEIYARTLSQGRLISTTGLGHSNVVTDPQTFAAVQGFLQGLQVGQKVVGSRGLAFELG